MLPVRRLNVRDRNGGEGPRRFIAEAPEDWTLEDPAGQPLDVVRTIRYEIDSRERALLDQLQS